MVASDFQRELMKEIEQITSQVVYQKADGERRNGVTAYMQQLPQVTEDEEDASAFFPYAIVRLASGDTQDDNDCWSIKTEILLGCYDDVLDICHANLPSETTHHAKLGSSFGISIAVPCLISTNHDFAIPVTCLKWTNSCSDMQAALTMSRSVKSGYDNLPIDGTPILINGESNETTVSASPYPISP